MPDFSPDDFNAAVQTVAGEAANQPPEAQAAVASTILNRHALLGGKIADIASDPNTYNGAVSDNAKQAVPGSPLYKTIASNIAPVFKNGPTTKATHFYAPGETKPAWDNGTGVKIGDQVFLDRSDLLKGNAAQPAAAEAPAPTADEIEAHINAPTPVTQSALPPIPGVNSYGAPLTPSADEIERLAGITPAPGAAPPTPAQLAAAKDAGTFGNLATNIAHIALHGPYGAGDVNTELPFLQGESQNFLDEIAGKTFAGLTGLRNALGAHLPYGMSEAEAAGTAAARQGLAALEAQHPRISKAAQFAGGAPPFIAGAEALGAGRAATQAATAFGRVAQLGGRVLSGGLKGAVIGAPAGALSALGAAQGDLADRAPAAGAGAALGGALGGGLGAAAPIVAPPVAAALGFAGREAGAAAGALGTGVRNVAGALVGRPGETTAADYFAAKSPTVQALKSATAAPDVAESVEPTPHETRLAQQKVVQMMAAKGMSRDDLRAIPTDIPYTTGEAIGSQTTNHAASLARRAGTTPDAAAATIAQRSEQFPDAVMDDFARAAGVDPRQARVLNEDVTETIHKDDVTPAYRAALDVEHPRPVMTATLAKLQQDPDVADALAQAQRFVAKSGRPTTMPGPKIDPDTGAQVLDSNTQQPVFEHQPTPEVWDMAKKFLDKAIVKDPRGQIVTSGIDGVKNVFLTQASKDMRGALIDAIPGYDKALASASDEASRKAAYSLGNRTLFDQTPVKDFQDARSKMTPDEQEAHAAGVANALFDKAQRGQLTPAWLKRPLVQAKLREVMGDNADEFIDRVMQRSRLQASGNRIAPGAQSQTAPLMIAGQETQPVVDALGSIGKELAHAKASPFTFIAKHGIAHALGDTGSNLAETPGYRNAYGRLLLQHPRETADELSNAPAISVRTLPPVKPRISALAGYAAGQATRAAVGARQ